MPEIEINAPQDNLNGGGGSATTNASDLTSGTLDPERLPTGVAAYAGDAGGTANAITITVDGHTETAGAAFLFRATAANTGATTIAVNGGTARAIRKRSQAGVNTALETGDLLVGQICEVVWDATNSVYQLTSQRKLASADIPVNPLFWGDKSNGDVTISSGTTTLTRNMYYNTLTINGSGSLNTAGFMLFADTIDLSAAPANAINPSGGAPGGDGGTAGASGSGGLPGNSNFCGNSAAGGAGGTGHATAPTNGAAGSSGHFASNGGVGGSSPGGLIGGNGGTFSTSYEFLYPPLGVTPYQIIGAFVTGASGGGGGAGGLGDGVSTGGGGGGGGGGARTCYIWARRIIVGAGTATGAITINPNAGGNGGKPSTGNGNGGGGGGGGGGGLLVVTCYQIDGNKADLISCPGGAGGNGGDGNGTGLGATGGRGGTGGKIRVFVLGTGQCLYANGSTGVAGSAGSGSTGGAGGAGGACLLSV